MKNALSLCIFLALNVLAYGQVKVGDNSTVITANSLFELESTNKGILIPRVSLVATNNVSPLSSPIVEGMLVYNNGTALTKGFYFWDGTKWDRFTPYSIVSSNNGNGNGGNNSGLWSNSTSNSTGIIMGSSNTNNQANGSYAMASGYNNNSSGNYSTAMGQNNTSSGTNAFTSGYNNNASGNYSTSVGQNNTSGGTNSFAAGYNNSTSGNYASAVGQNNQSTGPNTFTAGISNTASGNYATSLGQSNTASGEASFAAGYTNTASGQYSIALGQQAKAYNTASVSLGFQTEAGNNGSYTFATNYMTKAQGQYSAAFNYQTVASGEYSFVTGKSNTASGSVSFVVGESSTASSNNAIAIGANNTASGQYSIAMGRYANTNGKLGSFVLNDAQGTQQNSDYDNQFKAKFENGYVFNAGNNTSYEFNIGSSYRGMVLNSSELKPVNDNTTTLGASGRRWSTIYAANGVIQTSDKRFKENITSLTYGLETIMKIRPVSYTWINGNGERKIGFIAQELQQVVPEVVNVGDDADKTLGVNYAEMVSVLVKAMQEQQAQINALTTEVNTLKAENAAIKTQINDTVKR